jgi:hypothetical protein
MAHSSDDQSEIPQWKKHLCITRGVPITSVGSVTAGPDPLDGPFKAVFARGNKLWTSGATLTYAYIANPQTRRWKGTDRQHNKVDTIVKEWSIYANITFTRIEDTKLADIRICFKPGESWSGVGNDIRNRDWFPVNEPTMNLGWIDNTTDDILPEDHGVVLHEFGHTLGMEHEHQSPVRDSALTLNKELIYKIFGGSPNFWSKEEVDAQVINVLTLNDVSNFSKVDFTSIMMYEMKPELNREGIEIKRNQALDDLDKAFMTINYPRIGSNVTLPQGALPLEKALQIAGVTDEAVIAKILKSKDPSTVRFNFSAYIVLQQTKNLRFEK